MGGSYQKGAASQRNEWPGSHGDAGEKRCGVTSPCPTLVAEAMWQRQPLLEVGEFAVIKEDVGSKVIDSIHGDGEEGTCICINNVVDSV